MRRLSQTVHYDFEHNTFYKEKPDGLSSPSYFTGEPLKHFQPHLTGQNYLLRKLKLKHIESSKDKDQEGHHNTFQTISTDRPMRTQVFSLFHTRRHSQNTQVSPKNLHKPTELSKERKPHILPKEASLSLKLEPQELSREKSGSKLKQDLLNKTLNDYSKLLRQRSIEDHSPKHGQQPPPSPPPDPTGTLCTTISAFSRPERQWNKSSSKPRREIVGKLESGSKKKRRASQQRQLYERFYPVSHEREQKREAAQRQRKGNLKLLQELFIRNNDQKTNRIYQ